MRILSLVLFLVLSSGELIGQRFEAVPSLIDGLGDGGLEFGDFDLDGDLDVVMSGYDLDDNELISLYVNDGTGAFQIKPLASSGGDGDVAFLNLNGDQYPEILDYNYIENTLYFYDPSSGGFDDYYDEGLVFADFITLTEGSIINDGQIDMIVTAEYGLDYLLYDLPNITKSTILPEHDKVIIGDWRGVGSNDLLLIGENTSYLENTGTGLAIRNDIAILELISSFSELQQVVTADLDNDNLLDIIFISTTGELDILINNQNLSFEHLQVQSDAFIDNYLGNVLECKDIDNDGKLDIIISGYDVEDFTDQLFVLLQKDEFTFEKELIAEEVIQHWVNDFNSDGKLDILAQVSETEYQILLNINTSIAKNALTPIDFSAEVSGTEVMLSWNKNSLSDPVDIYSYDVEIKMEDEIVAHSVFSEDGFRISDFGPNAGYVPFYKINLDVGNYEARVRAVSQSDQVSPFSETIAFEVFDDYSAPDIFGVNFNFNYDTLDGVTALDRASFDFGDFDRDGDWDLVNTGEIQGKYYADLYENVGDNEFVLLEKKMLRPLRNSRVEFVDYDLDGQLDVFIMGVDTTSKNPTAESRLYKNFGNQSFIEVATFDIGSNSEYFGDDPIGDGTSECVDFDWQDYDKDSDLDLLISGYSTRGVRATRLYENTGKNTFVQVQITLELLSLETAGAVRWVDSDGDDDVDFVHAGVDLDDNLVLSVFENDQGVFSQNIIKRTNWDDTAFFNPSIQIIDFDKDKDLDIVFLAESEVWDSDSYHINLLSFVNTDNVYSEKFNLAYDITVTNNHGRNSSMLDANQDGNIDIISTGLNEVILWLGQGDGSYQDSTLIKELGDYVTFLNEGASTAPIVITEGSIFGIPKMAVVPMDNYSPPSVPNPSDLTSQVEGSSVLLEWNQPDNVYSNLSITDRAGNTIYSSNSLSNGNLISDPLYLTKGRYLSNLPDGTYDWTVQAVDYNLNISDKIAGESFTILLFEYVWLDSIQCKDCEILDESMIFNQNDQSVIIYSIYSRGFEDVVSNITNISVDLSTYAVDTIENLALVSFEVSDFNNDQKMDLIGLNTTTTTDELGNSDMTISSLAIYHGDGQGGFELAQELFELDESESGLRERGLVLGDLNSDGSEDILFTTDFGHTILTLNESRYETIFSSSDTGIPSIVDVNGDGRNDFFLNGFETSLYIQDESGFLKSNLILNGAKGDPVWADFDEDQYVDLILSTGVFNGITNKYFVNNGQGRFPLNPSSEIDGSFGISKIFDYNNNGEIDILFSGVQSFDYSRYTRIYSQEGNRFSDALISNLPDIYHTNIQPISRGKGILDLLSLSSDDDNKHLILSMLSNNTSNINVHPEVPTNLNEDIRDFGVTLSWSPPSDDHTISNFSYYFELYQKSESGLDYLVVGPKNSTGETLIASYSNVGLSGKIVIDSLADGTYYWKVRAYDLNGLASDFSNEESFEIFVGPKVISTTSSESFCLHEETTFTASPDAYEYEWEITGGSIINKEGTNEILIKWDEVGVGSVNAINKSFPTRSALLNYEVYPLPLPNFTTAENLSVNNYVVFVDSSSTDVTDWRWSFENGEMSNEQNPLHLLQRADNGYEVILTVSNEFTCSDSLTQSFLISDSFEMNISGVVTPNGDGNNDVLFIEYLDRFQNVKVMVFDQNNQVIYTSYDYQSSALFDFRSSNGRELPAGAYMVLLEVPELEYTTKQRVMLLR